MKQTTDFSYLRIMAELIIRRRCCTRPRQTYAAGYRQIDAYSPFPIEELADVIGFPKTRYLWSCSSVASWVASLRFALQYWCSAISYPIMVADVRIILGHRS